MSSQNHHGRPNDISVVVVVVVAVVEIVAPIGTAVVKAGVKPTVPAVAKRRSFASRRRVPTTLVTMYSVAPVALVVNLLPTANGLTSASAIDVAPTAAAAVVVVVTTPGAVVVAVTVVVDPAVMVVPVAVMVVPAAVVVVPVAVMV